LAAALALSVGEQPNSVFQKSESSPTSGLFNKGVPRDFTGNYELFGVVTHKGNIYFRCNKCINENCILISMYYYFTGRDADSGHYIGWVRQAEGSNSWWKFDDDIVSEIKTEEVLALRGGGDWHTAYLNFYRIKTNK
jgi:ubiquitin carboxyl-terminal hydrolase 14